MSKKRKSSPPIQLVMFGIQVDKPEPSEHQPMTFDFDTQAVRVYLIDGEHWWVAVDVCRILGLDSVSHALHGQTRTDAKGNKYQSGGLDEDEKGVHTVHTLGGNQELHTINESGLYSLILSSRKEEAKRFKRWVTREVLPAIRKTGSYSAPTGRVARECRRLNCDPQTGALRVEAFGVNKNAHSKLASGGASPSHFQRYHNKGYEVLLGRAAAQIREDLGVSSRVTPQDHMSFLVLNAKIAPVAIVSKIAAESDEPISSEQQIEMVGNFTRELKAKILELCGPGSRIGFRMDPQRGQIIDIIRNPELN